MWEDAMNKMFNPFNFFREWRMMCLSLCYNTFIRTFSPWIRWASYHFYSDVFPYDEHTNWFLREWFLWYDDLLTTFISILICRSVPMPVELFCPIAPYSTFSRWPTWWPFLLFNPRECLCSEWKKAPLDIHHNRLPLLCKLKIVLYGILLKWWKMLQRLPLLFVYLPNPTESVWPERKSLCVLFLENFFNKMRLPRIRTTRPHSFIILIPRSHSFIFKLLERSAI